MPVGERMVRVMVLEGWAPSVLPLMMMVARDKSGETV